MRKDNKAFRERFLRWKNGELVYDKGRPIDLYTDGKDDDDKDFADAIIGASIAENPAIMTAAGWRQNKNGKVLQKRTKADELLGANLSTLSTMSPTHPATAVLGAIVGKIAKPANVKKVYGMSLNGVKLNKQKAVDFFDDLIYGNLTPEAMSYVPQEMLPVSKTIPSETYVSIANSTVPRMAIHRPHMKAEDIARELDNAILRSTYREFPERTYIAAGQSKFGGFYNPDKNFVSIKVGETAPYARPHEFRHLVDEAMPMTESEERLVNLIFNKHFTDPDVEKITTIGDARRQLLGLESDLYDPILKQNRIIDRVSDKEIIEALEDANGYGKRYIANLRKANNEIIPPEIIKAAREGMKYLGINAGIGLTVPTTFDARKYKNGKDSIHIKPENRGKFTALKKRTGKSASWFKAHGTPAQRKMATFALNARKWKH